MKQSLTALVAMLSELLVIQICLGQPPRAVQPIQPGTEQSGTPQSGTPTSAQPIQPGIPFNEQPEPIGTPVNDRHQPRHQNRVTPVYDQPIPSGPSFTEGQSEISQLIKKLREAEDNAKKEAITKQIEAALTDSFDRDLEARQNDLEKLNDRMSKLRALFDRRRKAKTDIIQLQIKVLVNEAEGLGFGGHAEGLGFGGHAEGLGFGGHDVQLLPLGNVPGAVRANPPSVTPPRGR